MLIELNEAIKYQCKLALYFDTCNQSNWNRTISTSKQVFTIEFESTQAIMLKLLFALGWMNILLNNPLGFVSETSKKYWLRLQWIIVNIHTILSTSLWFGHFLLTGYLCSMGKLGITKNNKKWRTTHSTWREAGESCGLECEKNRS